MVIGEYRIRETDGEKWEFCGEQGWWGRGKAFFTGGWVNVTTHAGRKSVPCFERSQVDGHNVAAMPVKALEQLAGFDVPQGARWVTAPRQDLQ